MSLRRLLVVLLMTLGGPISLHAAIDSAFYTTYSLSPSGNQTLVLLSVCGSTPPSTGCVPSGILGPFSTIGGMLESSPVTNVTMGTVTRDIYVLDLGDGSQEPFLIVYKKVDTISAGSDSTVVTLLKVVTLPLIGGTAMPYMAANGSYLYIATNNNFGFFAQIKKSTLSVNLIGNLGQGNVTGITGDPYGYVTVTIGTGGTANFVVFNPQGRIQEFNVPNGFMLNTTQAFIPPPVQ